LIGDEITVDGHACDFIINKIQPYDDILRLYVPRNMAILGDVFDKPKELTITKFDVPKLCYVTEILAN
jgi:hypothetical protein